MKYFECKDILLVIDYENKYKERKNETIIDV